MAAPRKVLGWGESEIERALAGRFIKCQEIRTARKISSQ